MQGDEEWVYRVFVAPGPSYVATAHASSEFPFIGEAFSYIVPAGAATPFPSLAALDVGCVGGIEKRSGPEGAERAYMIVLNAVDTIRVLEVCLPTVVIHACLQMLYFCGRGREFRVQKNRERGFRGAENKN